MATRPTPTISSVEQRTGVTENPAPRVASARRSPRTYVLVAGACFAVLIVVLLVVLVGGSLSPAGQSGPTTFSESAADAGGIVSSVPNGPWVLTGALGMGVTVPFALNNSIAAEGCNVTSGSFGTSTYPSGDGAYSGGQATVWILSYVTANPSAGTLYVQVINGAASEMGVVTGGKCVGNSALEVGTVVDSSAAMQAVLSTTNGSRFVQAFPRANATLSLTTGPESTWIISLNGCGRYYLGPGTLLASVWAANGTIQNSPREPAVISC